MTDNLPSRDWCLAQDAADPLAATRGLFALPDGIIYLDGNSLGAPPVAAAARAAELIGTQWGQGLVSSWNSAGWVDLPVRLGQMAAPLIGADADEVIVCDSASINLFKLLSTAIAMRPERGTIIMEAGDFPTNGYIAQGLSDRATIRFVARDQVADAVDTDTIALCLTHAHFKTGQVHDMASLTMRAHAAGALAIWDISHSVGALPVDLNCAAADFATGCTYKFLNGGPGAPAMLFAAKRHLNAARQPLQGWWGHADPFAFEADYVPRGDIHQFLTGTPPILSMALVETGLAIHRQADMALLRVKSQALGDLMIRLIEGRCADHGFVLVSPRDASQRSSQVSFAHPQGYPIMQALIAAGVIGDFRAPDLLRFGFAPLYVRFVDIWDAVDRLAMIMDSRTWAEPRFAERQAVT